MTETATRVAASTESHTARIDLGSHSSLQEIGVVITDLGIVLRDPPGSSFFETQSPGPQARVKQIRYRNPLEITIELASGTMNWTPLAVVALALFFGRGPEERARAKQIRQEISFAEIAYQQATVPGVEHSDRIIAHGQRAVAVVGVLEKEGMKLTQKQGGDIDAVCRMCLLDFLDPDIPYDWEDSE